MKRFLCGAAISACVVGCSSSSKQQRAEEQPVQQQEAPAQQTPEQTASTEPEVEMDLSAGLKRPPVTRNAAALAALEQAAQTYKSAEAGNLPVQRLVELYQQALAADPKLAVAHYNLGVLAEHSGNLQEAEDAYRKAVSMDPTLDVAVANLGALLERQPKGEQASTKLYKAVLDRNPRSVAARVRLGELSLERGKAHDAQELARAALGYDPRSLECYRLLARTYLVQKKYSLAKLMALRGLKLREKDPPLTVTMGEVLLAEEDTAAGLATLQNAVEYDGNQLSARFQLARAAFEVRDYAGSATQYQEILRRDTDNAVARYQLALSLQGQGKFAQARDVLTAALAQNPKDPEPRLLLADLYMRHLAKYPAAKEELKTYVKLKGGSLKSKHPAMRMLAQVDELIRVEEESRRQLEELKRMEEAELAQQRALEAEEAKAAQEEAAKAQEGQAAPEGQAPGEGQAPAEGQPPAAGETPASEG